MLTKLRFHPGYSFTKIQICEHTFGVIYFLYTAEYTLGVVPRQMEGELLNLTEQMNLFAGKQRAVSGSEVMIVSIFTQILSQNLICRYRIEAKRKLHK